MNADYLFNAMKSSSSLSIALADALKAIKELDRKLDEANDSYAKAMAKGVDVDDPTYKSKHDLLYADWEEAKRNLNVLMAIAAGGQR